MTESTKAMSFRDEFKGWATRHGWDISEAFTIDGKASFIDATVNALWGGWHGRACADFRSHLAPREVSDEDVTIPGPPYTAQKVLELRNRLDDRLRDDKYAIALAVAMLDEFRELLLQADRQRGGGVVKFDYADAYRGARDDLAIAIGRLKAAEALLAQRGQVREGFVMVPLDKFSLIRQVLHSSEPIPEVVRTFPDSTKTHREIYAFVEVLERMHMTPDADAEGK